MPKEINFLKDGYGVLKMDNDAEKVEILSMQLVIARKMKYYPLIKILEKQLEEALIDV